VSVLYFFVRCGLASIPHSYSQAHSSGYTHVWLDVARGKPTRLLDAHASACVHLCAVCLSVVVKSSLGPFDCVSLGAVRVLESEPAVLCDASVRSFARMRAVAALSVVVFVLGLPAALTVFLARTWSKVQQDQRLRERGEGDSQLTNPHFHFRRRFRKVYEDYRPAHAYWKVVVLLRKLCLGLVVVLGSG
jgi:hypothetical protein